jgi:hypothetical protein
MGHRFTRAAVTGVSALALCGLGAGVALAAPSPTAAPVATAAHVKHPGQHGEFTGQGKAHRAIDFQRGTVTSVAGSTMTVRSADGYTQTYTSGPEITVRKEKQASSASAIQANDRIFVAAVKEADGLRAVRVRDHGDAPAKPQSSPAAPAPSATMPTTPQ